MLGYVHGEGSKNKTQETTYERPREQGYPTDMEVSKTEKAKRRNRKAALRNMFKQYREIWEPKTWEYVNNNFINCFGLKYILKSKKKSDND